jgi:hypothetical protein
MDMNLVEAPGDLIVTTQTTIVSVNQINCPGFLLEMDAMGQTWYPTRNGYVAKKQAGRGIQTGHTHNLFVWTLKDTQFSYRYEKGVWGES